MTGQERVAMYHKYLTIDDTTGVLTWKLRTRDMFPCDASWKLWNGSHAGKVAGCVSTRDQYRVMRIEDVMYREHRVVWEMIHGPIPSNRIQIDHINMVRWDNRPSNLRLATNAQNNCNTGKRSDNKSGFKGVSKHGQTGRWTARIHTGSQYKHLGCFATPEEASDVYNAAAKKYHGEFART